MQLPRRHLLMWVWHHMKMKWRIGIISTTLVLASTCIATFIYHLLIKRRRVRQMIESTSQVLDVSDCNITVINDEYQCEQYFAQQCQMSPQWVGLDCEWISTNNRNQFNTDSSDAAAAEAVYCKVALLQIAFPNKDCALVRLCNIRKITSSLAELLQDRKILKFGVGILNDVNRLASGFNVITEGVVDLRNIALRCGIRKNYSLGGLTRQLVNRDLVKTKDITCSNWEQPVLSGDQVKYAASDAIAALLILGALINHKLSNRRSHWGLEEEHPLVQSFQQSISTDSESLSPTNNTERDNNGILNLLLNDEAATTCILSLCQGLVGTEFKQLSKTNRPLTDKGGIHSERTTAYSVRKTPLYYNCQLKAPDGTLLSTVDQKKVDWYISKGLGVLVSEDPPTVQLLFEPSGKPNKDREYYLTEKENICVVCGKSDSYIRKNVIPHEYRKYFPKEMKEHISHDVLLMCVSCHQYCDNHDRFMRRDIALQYNVPVDAGTQKYREDTDRVKVRSLARAMIGQRQSLPDKRREEIMDKLTEYLECKPSDVTPELLQQLANTETRIVNADFVSHGELVVQSVLERGELIEFQRKWRIHFLECTKPRFLPKLWSVDHNPRVDNDKQ